MIMSIKKNDQMSFSYVMKDEKPTEDEQKE
jgi:hypothetical protein